jgi:hypothetical protein
VQIGNIKMQNQTTISAQRITQYWRLLSFTIAFLSMISVGCGIQLSENMVVDPTQTEKNSPSNHSAPLEIQKSVLKNCDIASQEAALSPDLIPAWNNLPISTCYRLWLDLQGDPRVYEGKAELTFTNLTDEILNDLVFRLYPNAERIYGGMLEVTSAWVRDKPIQPILFLTDNTAMRLKLVDPIRPGQTVDIVLEFDGRLTNGLQGSPRTYGLFNYSMDEGVATYINWFPMLSIRDKGRWQADPVVGIGDSVVSEVSLYFVEITAPKDLQVVTSGSILRQSDKADLKTLMIASGPIRDFPVVTGSNFTLVQEEVDGITINHWGLPGGEQLWEEALQTAVDSLVIFNELYGKYPYREMDIVNVPLQLASGVEYPGLFLMKDELYRIDLEDPYLLITIIAHETAHQWWYGLVGNNVIENPWQDEALTTFSSLIYLELFRPQLYEGTLDYFQKNAEDAESNLKNSDISQPVSAFINIPEYYSPVVYSKGAVFFLELRKRLGDPTFFKALQNYFSTHLYGISSPGDLLSAFESSCQCELDDFYSQWGVE